MFKQNKKLTIFKRALAFMLSVMMIFLVIPESAYIAKAEEELPTGWNFTADGGFTTAVTDAEYQSLKVSGTLRPNNNSAQISSGGSISVPVTGTCDIKVVGYPGYYDYAVNGTTVSRADETVR